MFFFAGEIPMFNLGGEWILGVDMFVAPTEPRFEADALNKFMLGMIKSVRPNSHDTFDFFEHTVPHLRLGRLEFYEVVARIVREVSAAVTIYDPEAMKAAGIELNPTSHTTEIQELKRRTWVRVYPDVTSAKLIYEYQKGIVEDTLAEAPKDIDQLKYNFPQTYLEVLKGQYQNPRSGIIGRITGR